MYYGLSYKEVRALAYGYAVKLGVRMTESWRREKRAGCDWLFSFMRRHPNLPGSSKEPMPGCSNIKKRGRPKKIVPVEPSSESESDLEENFCCVCGEVLPYIRTNKRCGVCLRYAHAECGKPDSPFSCINCDSDGPWAEESSGD